MYKAAYIKYPLVFNNAIQTSRGTMLEHDAYIIVLTRLADGKTTYGEASPLPGLSIDAAADFEKNLTHTCALVSNGLNINNIDAENFPSIYFAFETAYLCMQTHQAFLLFDNTFASGTPITINGLVWMNSTEKMLEEALQKVQQGFLTIKFKIGALDFDSECRMLELFRKQFPLVEIRLDANGAFSVDDALQQLKELARFNIHSVEQPIKPKQWEVMQEICAKAAIPIALDEELIGVNVNNEAIKMLKIICPHYVIIKPTLIGGLAKADAWTLLAEKYTKGWWATSALESNIALNAIAQWVSTKNNILPQGLGTGQLYKNNISSPLQIVNGKIVHSKQRWDAPKQ